ncbi:MAG: ankyrin repeat domain-containing protein [Akkermansiaceae bacterium]|nr:ankyrin repeat domain-containing protein [Akkermansiaceae bacterium]
MKACIIAYILVSTFVLLLSCGKGGVSSFEQAEIALSEANIPELKKIITRDPKVVRQRRSYDQATLLHQACSAGYHPVNEKIIRILVSNGAGVNVKDDLGRTPVHWIMYYGDNGEKLLPYFVKHGAEVQITDVYGKKPEDY